MIRGKGEYRRASMEQLDRFHEMGKDGQLHHDLFQLFLEDPWRILEAVWIRSDRPCDMPSLSSAIISSSLGLGEHLREEEIPWVPELGTGCTRLRLQRGEWQQTAEQIKGCFASHSLLAGTLADLMRLARWHGTFSWEIPVVALGSPIVKQVMGRSQVFYPFMRERTLRVVLAEGLDGKRERPFYLGREKAE